VNVAAQREDPTSMLSLTRRLLELRRDHPALADGDLELLDGTPDGVLAYRRAAGDARILVVLNLTDAPATMGRIGTDGRVLIGTHPGRVGAAVGGALRLRPNEAVVVEEG
jgi:alpha-glucosidase